MYGPDHVWTPRWSGVERPLSRWCMQARILHGSIMIGFCSGIPWHTHTHTHTHTSCALQAPGFGARLAALCRPVPPSRHSAAQKQVWE